MINQEFQGAYDCALKVKKARHHQVISITTRKINIPLSERLLLRREELYKHVDNAVFSPLFGHSVDGLTKSIAHHLAYYMIYKEHESEIMLSLKELLRLGKKGEA